MQPTTDLAVLDRKVDLDNVNKIAIRRGKVRELFRMGYEPHQIVLILDKGIKVGEEIVKVPLSEQVVRADIEYITQEDAAVDVEFPQKRAEVIDKLKFLYRQAVGGFMNAKGAVRNSFLNTALSVLNKIADIEGINATESANGNTNNEAKLTKFANEVQNLEEKDRNVIIVAIRQVLGERQQESTGESGVLSEPSRVSAQASDDEGVPGES
jgi:hypothetical protein